MKKFIFVLLASAMILPACTPLGLATGAGAVVGTAAAKEGGLSAAATDARIQIEINDLWFKYDVDTFRKLNMTVDQGRVLLTGVVQNPEARVEAVRLAWQPKGVKQVINEIRVAKSDGITGYARDTWISTRLRASITFDRDIQSINYSIDTVQGVVYLMGVAQGQGELNRVIEKARTIPDVKQVVSYVKLAGQSNQGWQPQDYSGDDPNFNKVQEQYPGQSSTDPNAPYQNQPPAYSQDSVTVPADNGPTAITPQPLQTQDQYQGAASGNTSDGSSYNSKNYGGGIEAQPLAPSGY